MKLGTPDYHLLSSRHAVGCSTRLWIKCGDAGFCGLLVWQKVKCANLYTANPNTNPIPNTNLNLIHNPNPKPQARIPAGLSLPFSARLSIVPLLFICHNFLDVFSILRDFIDLAKLWTLLQLLTIWSTCIITSDITHFNERSNTEENGNNYKLLNNTFYNNIHKHFFTACNVIIWNSLIG